MLGVILCGGQSTRMGTDKAMMKTQGNTWAECAGEKLAALDIPVVFSVNSKQYAEYAAILDPSTLVVDNTNLTLRGPVCAMLTLHKYAPMEDLFILACDMPLVEQTLLNKLYQIYKENSLADAFFYVNTEEPEPLCAIYTARGLAQINYLYLNNKLVKHSMKFMLENLKTMPVIIADNELRCFTNFNSHAELNGF